MDKVHQRTAEHLKSFYCLVLYHWSKKVKRDYYGYHTDQKEKFRWKWTVSGNLFYQTPLKAELEEIVWVIESTFRCLKTDLDLRSIYHKKDSLSIIGNYPDYQYAKKLLLPIKNIFNETIYIRWYTKPNKKVKTTYQALEYRYYPFVKWKSGGHKSEFKKSILSLQQINDS